MDDIYLIIDDTYRLETVCLQREREFFGGRLKTFVFRDHENWRFSNDSTARKSIITNMMEVIQPKRQQTDNHQKRSIHGIDLKSSIPSLVVWRFVKVTPLSTVHWACNGYFRARVDPPSLTDPLFVSQV